MTWSMAETEYARYLFGLGELNGAIGARLGRSGRAVQGRLKRMYGSTKRTPSVWTPEAMEFARSRWELKWSSGQIAADLGFKLGLHITRNQVVGFLWRNGLSFANGVRRVPSVRLPLPRANDGRRSASKRPGRPEAVFHPRLPTRAVTIVVEKPLFFCSYPLEDLPPKTCRFPDGDGPFKFCGVQVVDDSSYCGYHHAVCYLSRKYKQRPADRQGAEAPPSLVPRGKAGVPISPNRTYLFGGVLSSKEGR